MSKKQQKDIKKLKKLNSIIISLGVLICCVGIGYFGYDYTRPFNIYERALKKTMLENKVSIKNTLISTGEITELSSQSVLYSIDKNNKTFQVTKNIKDNEDLELLLVDDKIYLKDEEKYVNIANSEYLNKFTNNLKMEGNNIYDDFQQQLRDGIDKKNISVSKINKRIGEEDLKLLLLEFKVCKNNAKEIVSSYIRQDFNTNSEFLIEETIKTQEELYKTSGKSFLENEKKELKEEMLKLLQKNLSEKLKNIDYSDITIKVGIDSKGFIRYREEDYSITIDEKENNLKNITEYISFGKDVSIKNENELDIESLEVYMERQKEKQKETFKTNSLENPEEKATIKKSNK